MIRSIGIVAEDESDVACIKTLIRRSSGLEFGFKQFAAKGSGKLEAKCAAWIGNLSSRGCEIVIVVRDCDGEAADVVSARLRRIIGGDRLSRCVLLLPRQSIEAWFLADLPCIYSFFEIASKPRRLGPVEGISKPKDRIRELVRTLAKRTYDHTIHNDRLAATVDLGRLRQCSSFIPLAQLCARLKQRA